MSNAGLHVTALAFPGISPFHLAVPCLVFGEDRREIGLPAFTFQVCTLEAGPVMTSAGLELSVRHGLDELLAGDIIIIPSWHELDEAPPQRLLDGLVRAHARGAQIVGLCLGSYVVAATGLLDGRSATTHWEYAAHYAGRFPRVSVDPAVLYVDEGSVITSAGVAAALDCCLHMVRARFGADIAAKLARRLVVAPHRQGGQAQFIERPVAKNPAVDRFAILQGEVARHPDRRWTVEDAAALAAMSRRSFTRHFQARFGTTYGRWLLNQRLAHAQNLLETTLRPIDDIAFDAGFGSASALRQHFAEDLRTSPSRYRREFRQAGAQT
jgi:AraC family transcriptional regulator, transcriptional activator FtrA